MEQSSRRSWAQSPGEKQSEPTTVTREYSISPNNYSTSSPVPIIGPYPMKKKEALTPGVSHVEAPTSTGEGGGVVCPPAVVAASLGSSPTKKTSSRKSSSEGEESGSQLEASLQSATSTPVNEEGGVVSPSTGVAALPEESQKAAVASVNKEGGVFGLSTESPAALEDRSVESKSSGYIKASLVSGSRLNSNDSGSDIECVWDSESSWDEGGESPRAGESPQAAAAIRGYVEGSGASPSAVVATPSLEPQPVTSASVNKEGGVVGVFTETPATWEELARSTSNSRGSRNSSSGSSSDSRSEAASGSVSEPDSELLSEEERQSSQCEESPLQAVTATPVNKEGGALVASTGMAASLRVPVKDEKGTGEPLADMEVEGPRSRSSSRTAAPTFVSKEGGVVVLPTKVSAAAVSGRTLTGSRGQDALKEVSTQSEEAEGESPAGAEGISVGKSTSSILHADFMSLIREENNRRAAEQEQRDQRFFSLLEASQQKSAAERAAEQERCEQRFFSLLEESQQRSQQMFEASQQKLADEQERREQRFFSLLEESQLRSQQRFEASQQMLAAEQAAERERREQRFVSLLEASQERAQQKAEASQQKLASEQEERDQRLFSSFETRQQRSQQLCEERQHRWAAEHEKRDQHFLAMLEASQQRSQQMLSETFSQFASTQEQTLNSIALSSSSIQPLSCIHSPGSEKNTTESSEHLRRAEVDENDLSPSKSDQQDRQSLLNYTQQSIKSLRRAAATDVALPPPKTSLQQSHPPSLPSPKEEKQHLLEGVLEKSGDDKVDVESESLHTNKVREPKEEIASSARKNISDEVDEVSTESPREINTGDDHGFDIPIISIITPTPKVNATESSKGHSSTRSQQRDNIDRRHLNEGAWREEEFYINQLPKKKSLQYPSTQHEGITRAADFNIHPSTMVTPGRAAGESILKPPSAESGPSNESGTRDNLPLELNKVTRRTGAAENLKPPSDTQQTDLVRGAISNSVNTERADISRNNTVVTEQHKRNWTQSPGGEQSESTTVTREYFISQNNYANSSPGPIKEAIDPSAQSAVTRKKARGRSEDKASSEIVRKHSYYIPLAVTRKKVRGRSEDKASSEIVRKHSYYIPL
eukprot:CAMPEP_0194743630 /NCGR_PEP_ID=MMETSP0296-20130528/100410_1 /TAXON_ID=39354 /ORGANISM="Heterosigma akashiwo, Strain CCMP2393" /LENGTH=1109 /DNA_ID=CAMNT_0039655673 /DNA_START=2232 /DNA_END=5560 /DNA_ORIENTATION=+